MMLTLKDWDDIASELEPQVMSNINDEKVETYMWALYGGLLQHMKDTNMSIDEVLVICEEKVTGKTKGLSKKS
ncbi:Hypothetical protein DAR_50 [Enterococcus phage dArtagnan]|uniref:Uncharacterized protein n=2 Tax=Aramisvirus TaxID=3152613 RepID=A0A8D6UH94_9CAUD|nr:Hypothetical protein ARAMI_52 [Enterococcus phage Aramis]CAD7767794.1 Hypothetical protein DAR_50 [Enterococcus phage dArtagnan]